MLQVPIPEASRKDKKLCQSFGQLVFKICYSPFFHASTRFQKSLVSAKQIWAPRGIPQCPKQAQRPHSGKQFTACPASGMCDSHCAPGIGQGHQGENIQEEIRAAVWFWKVAARVPFLNMWPQALPFTLRCYLCSIQVFREVKCFQSSPSPAPIYKYNTATINSVYLYFTIVCLLMLNEAQDSQMWCCSLKACLGSRGTPTRPFFPDWCSTPTPLFVSLQQSSGDSWEIPIRWAWGCLQL